MKSEKILKTKPLENGEWRLVQIDGDGPRRFEAQRVELDARFAENVINRISLEMNLNDYLRLRFKEIVGKNQ